ncbi:MAG TPA: periplasmic heavy metal sensor [Thermoanaerobaculia bacterium]
MKRTLIGAIALALVASALVAQEMPPGKWWQRQEIVRDLGLTNEQRDRLDGIFRDSAPQLVELRDATQKKAQELRAQIDRPVLDREAIQRAAADVSEARARLFERELMMLVEMRGVLNQQQWTRFRDAIENRQQMQRRGAPGMMPGPGQGGRGMRPGGGGGRRRP